MSTDSGQSVIEVIVAVSIMVIMASGTVIAILGSLSSSRLGKEESRATFLAAEGVEAVGSIRNQAWNNLVIGNHGLSHPEGNWVFSGTSDIDDSGKFTRVVSLNEVFRDENGQIVDTGGTMDLETIEVVVNVSWNYTPTRDNEVEITSYLTDWQLSKSTGEIGGGTLISCDSYCQSLDYTDGACRATQQTCSVYDEIYEAGGDQYCIEGPQVDTCCCLP